MVKRRLLVCMTIAGVLAALALSLGASAQEAEPPVLAAVDLTGEPDALELPVYAHLQTAEGHEYVLVVAAPSELEQSELAYRRLDVYQSPSERQPGQDGLAYYIALLRNSVPERRPGAREQAGELVDVLHDDGRQLVVCAAPEQAEALAELGFDLQRLGDTPLVWRTISEWRTPFLNGAWAETWPDPLVASMIDQVQQSALYSATARLSGEWPALVGGELYTFTTRHTSSGLPLQKATQYAYEHLQALGLDVSYHDWNSGYYSNRNVIGVLTGTLRPDEIVLVGAHIDDLPSSGRAPGADDNASGSVAVLTAAKILSLYQFERTLRFVLFTGEEQGLLGSTAYAERVYAAGENVVAVYNMDMIAWDDLGGPVMELHTRLASDPGYPADLAIAGVFTQVVSAYGLSGSLAPGIKPDGIRASDHSPFWTKGYPAILAIEDHASDFNDYYHTANDKLIYLDMAYFTSMVKASLGTVAHLAYPRCRRLTWSGAVSADWHTAANWDEGRQPGLGDGAIIPSNPAGGRWPVISAPATCCSLTVEPGAQVVLSGELDLVVEGFVANHGLLSQSKPVDQASGPVEFLAVGSMGGRVYPALVISPAGNLGEVQVTVHDGSCDVPTVLTQTVQRCYEITPLGNGTPSVRPASVVTFYYRSSEANGNLQPSAWHWNASAGAWDVLDSTHGGAEPGALWVQAAVTDYSPFTLKDYRPVAVALRTFLAGEEGSLGLLVAGVFVVAAWGSVCIYRRTRA